MSCALLYLITRVKVCQHMSQGQAHSTQPLHVPISVYIVEHESDLLKMRYADLPRDAGGYGVEPITICGNAIGSPSLTRASTVCNHHRVAEVSCTAPVGWPVMLRKGDIANFLDRRNQVVGCVWVGFQQPWSKLCADVRSFSMAGCKVNKVLRAVDADL